METKISNSVFVDFLLKSRYRPYRHLLLLLTVFLMTGDVFWYQEEQPLTFWQRFIGWLFYFGTVNGMMYVNVYLLTPRFLLKNRLVLFLLSVIFTATVSITLTVLVQDSVYNLVSDSSGITVTQMILNTVSGCLTIGLLISGSSAVVLLRHWIRHNQRIDELESTTLQSELKYLKSQINPHFLFNMLNNANVLTKRNPEEASKVLFKLEDLLRYQINDSSREKVSLTSDIRFLNDFLNLEKIRRDQFEYSIRQEGAVDSIWIQPLLFIPFVENAVKHNFDSEHPSYVHLSFVVKDRQLIFHCENSKPMVTTEKKKVGGIGLVNIHRRLELLYPGSYLLEISDTEQKYTLNLHLNL